MSHDREQDSGSQIIGGAGGGMSIGGGELSGPPITVPIAPPDSVVTVTSTLVVGSSGGPGVTR